MHKQLFSLVALPFSFVLSANSYQPIFTGSCSSISKVDFLYSKRLSDAYKTVYEVDKRNLYTIPNRVAKPFWDIRYVNEVSQYANGGSYSYANHSKYTGLDTNNGDRNVTVGTNLSKTIGGANVFQSECIGGSIAAGSMLNLWDAPVQKILYGGPQASFSYVMKSGSEPYPWKSNKTGNLMIQGLFEKPWYYRHSKNLGGELTFNVFMQHRYRKGTINYVIKIYNVNNDFLEPRNLHPGRVDPNTGALHVTSSIMPGNIWTTKSQYSSQTQGSRGTNSASDDNIWPDFYRVNISYENLRRVLQAVGKVQDPENWKVTSIAVFSEIEEEANPASGTFEFAHGSFGSSFRAFSAYVSEQPM